MNARYYCVSHLFPESFSPLPLSLLLFLPPNPFLSFLLSFPPTLSVSQPVIYLNLVCSMCVIVINMKKLGIPFSSPINRVSRIVSVNVEWRPNKVVLVTSVVLVN